MSVSGFLELVAALLRAEVRFVLIGVEGVNHYARAAGTVFTTHDRDLFLPSDAANEQRALQACSAMGMHLWCGDEPLGGPFDLDLAERVVERRALVRATGQTIEVDLTLVMAGFEFEPVWAERRLFRVRDIEVPVARLAHIIASKAAAARPKDQSFLATHEDALRQLLPRRFGRRP